MLKTETITDICHTGDLVLLANTPAQAESDLHGLKQAAESIDLQENANKTDYVYFKGEWAIFKWQVSKNNRQAYIPRQ